MAAAAATSAARSMPAVYTVPLGPRTRPPRLLPGTKAENTNPQPEGPVPFGKVWIQGRWRERNSNAAKDRILVQSAQVEKALRQSTHGMNIYAYRQIRTNQVVYSLSRVMQNNKILSQLVYHGKQTKPAALRRDVWRPYFSIHFPQTAAGAEAGLDTYQMLRELSARRQLSPLEGSLLATKDDVDKARAKYDPATLARMKEEKSTDLSKLPRIGQLLPPKYRAKKLMDQKASSVADVAFALSLVGESPLSPHDKQLRAETRLKSRHSDRSRRNRRRINEIRRQQEAKAIQVVERQKLVDPRPGQLGVDKHAAVRIALEHNGVLIEEDRVTGLEHIRNAHTSTGIAGRSLSLHGSSAKPPIFDVEEFRAQFTQQWEEQHKNTSLKPLFPTEELENLVQKRLSDHREEVERWEQNAQKLEKGANAQGQSSRQVLVLWSDLKDAMHAGKWTANVQHDWFDAKAVVKEEKTVVRQPAYTDGEGHHIEEQRQKRLFQVSSTPHIIGRDVSDSWLTDMSQLAKVEDTNNLELNFARREHILHTMIMAKAEMKAFREDYALLETQYLALEQEPKAKQRKTKSSPGTSFENGLEFEYIAATEVLKEKQQRVDFLCSRYPEYDEALDRLEYFTDLIARHQKLAKVVEALEPGVEGREKLMSQEHALAKEIRDQCDTQFPGFSAFERKHQETLLQSQSEARMKELEAESEAMKVKVVLSYHRKLLERQGDDDYKLAARDEDEPNSNVTNTGRNMNQQELKEMNIEVDMQELDKRSMWSRVKGVFGR